MTPPRTENPIRRLLGAIKRFIDANTAFAEGEPSAPLSARPAGPYVADREDDGFDEVRERIRAYRVHLAANELKRR